MSRDPKKLPRWARDMVEGALARTALGWPTYDEPNPAYSYKGYCYGKAPSPTKYWITRGREAEPVWVDERGYCYEQEDMTGHPSRPHGLYYATRLDALKAVRWRESREVAERLRKIDAMIEQEISGGGA